MNLLIDHTEVTASFALSTLNDMFDVSFTSNVPASHTSSFESSKDFFVSILFTGSVYGEYIIAFDNESADFLLRKLGMDEIDAELKAEVFGELLNTIAGSSLVELGSFEEKLSLLTPRTHFGQAAYPAIPTGKSLLHDETGHEIEVFFLVDPVRLDLTVSYESVVEDLKTTNTALLNANQKLQEQQAKLVQAEKMISIGMLASGVAHEINNPVQYIQYNLEALEGYQNVIKTLLSLYQSISRSIDTNDISSSRLRLTEAQQLEEKEDIRFLLNDTEQLIQESQEGVQRIREIVSALSCFARPSGNEHEPANINEGIQNTLNLVAGKLGPDCTLKLDLQEIPSIPCNIGELNQVFLNLLVNAQHAVGDKGVIEVSTRQERESIIITIADDGCGISEENLEKIFVPFYTTKPVGEGTGLGMYISYQIVEQHRGKIEVNSKIDVGTSFSIQLPI